MGGILGFAESPAQLLNIIEWATATDTAPRIIVLGPPEPVTRFQLHRLMELVRADGFNIQWAEVRHRVTAWSDLVRQVTRARTLVLGDPYAAIAHVLLTVAAHDVRIVVVDDGTATLRYAEQWASGVALQRWHVAHRSLPLRVAGLRAGNLLGRRSDRVELFSAMPLDTELPVMANTYAWARSRFPAPHVLAGTDLMGTSLVETGVVSAEAYHQGVVRLIEERGVARYLPHRHEAPAKLAAIAAQGVQIVRPDLPMEIHARRGPVGSSILSFPSTVLHTLPLVLTDTPVSIEALSVDDAWFTPQARAGERAFVHGI